MAQYRIDLVEQPVSRHDLKGLELVTRSVPVVVEADEGAGTIDEIMTLVSNRIVDAVSLKIPKLGGLAQRARRGAHLRGRQGQIPARRPCRHPARSTPMRCISPPRCRGVDYACELGEFSRMYDDPFAGIEVVDGVLTVPDRPGCGVDPVAGGQGANLQGSKLQGAA